MTVALMLPSTAAYWTFRINDNIAIPVRDLYRFSKVLSQGRCCHSSGVQNPKSSNQRLGSILQSLLPNPSHYAL